MRTLELPRAREDRLRVLALGCHADDIEIGCGGTLLPLARAYPDQLEVDWVVFSRMASGARRPRRARATCSGACGAPR